MHRAAADAFHHLVGWLDEPTADAGMHVATDIGWSYHDYSSIARRTASVAAQLLDGGLARGGVVNIVLPSGVDFVATFFGVLAAGGTPSPLVPPGSLGRSNEFVGHAARILEVARPSTVVTSAPFAPLVEAAANLAGRPGAVVVLEPESTDEWLSVRPAELALLQFTSGSSGSPRGVQVPWENLSANLAMIERWLGWSGDDAVATWLPMYHDMGLIGNMLVPVTSQRDLWMMSPEQFVRRPARWLECFGRHGATFGASPSFGYQYVVRRVRSESLAGFDFSGWKGAIIGADRPDARTLMQFGRLLGPYGFRLDSFLPAYGLAEATLAVSGSRPAARMRAVRPDWDALRLFGPVPVLEEGWLGEPGVADSGEWILSSGRPLSGLEVSAVDEDGGRLAEGWAGELLVSGSSVAQGYRGEAREGVSTQFCDDGLRTGDGGFVLDGELFVLGRLGDSIKVRGRRVFVEDLEARLRAVPGMPADDYVVLPGLSGSPDSLVVLVVKADADLATAAATALHNLVGDDAVVDVYRASRNALLRTSSGKPRRRAMWLELARGGLDASRLLRSGPSEARTDLVAAQRTGTEDRP